MYMSAQSLEQVLTLITSELFLVRPGFHSRYKSWRERRIIASFFSLDAGLDLEVGGSSCHTKGRRHDTYLAGISTSM